MSQAGDLRGEFQALGRRLAGLSEAQRARLGDRAASGLELLVDRGHDLAHLVVVGRAAERELARLDQVAKLARAQLDRVGAVGRNP